MSAITLTAFMPIPLGTQSFTKKEEEVFFSLAGAQSFGFFDQNVSVGRSYRNELSASYIGRQWLLFIEQSAPTPLTSPQAFHKTWTWAPTGLVTESGTDASLLTIDQVMDAIAAADDRFNATPPHNEPLVMTFMAFMDGIDGTGKCVALCLASDFDAFSPTAPSRY